MEKTKLKDILYLTGGNTKIVIYNVTTNTYEELYRGNVDNIKFKDAKYGDSEVEHITVVNGEDYLQIHIEL